MSEHVGFTRQEATETGAGEIRGIILDAIASRCGQVPDLHPRLLEGIEVAARRIQGKLRSGALASGVTASIDESAKGIAYRTLHEAAWDLDQQGMYEVAAWLRDRAANIATLHADDLNEES